jgi:hypothetical protein
MLGSSLTQQLFASANSIAVIPKVWAEWNYNAFVQPYVVTTSSVSSIGTLNSSAIWTSKQVDTNSSSVGNGTISYATGVSSISSKVSSSANPINFTIIKKLSNSDKSSYSSGKIMAKFASDFINFSSSADGNFYKFVFYVKVGGNQKNNYGTPKQQKITSLTTSASGSVPFTYRIAGVNSSNMHIQNPLALPAQTVNSSISGNITLKWSASVKPDHSSAYKIYRTIGTSSINTQYLTTVTSGSYVDTDLTRNPDPYTIGTYTNDVFISPQIVALDPNQNNIPISFFVKSTDFSTGGLSSVESSIQATVDVWKRVEIWFGTPGDSGNGFSRAQLWLNAVAEYEGAQFMVSDIELYQVTEHDFYLNNYYPAESVFKPFRPGEALLHPLLQTSDKSVKTDTYTASVVKPASFAIKNPGSYFAKEITAPLMQMLPSEYDKFSYHITSGYDSQKSIQARYNQYLSINKIVLKYSNFYTNISGAKVILYTGSGNSSTSITLQSTDFNKNGVTTLYYNGSSWSTSSWTSPPQLSSSGTFQNTLNQVKGITLLVTNVSGGNAILGNYEVPDADRKKAHILEISPRLEVDLSPIVSDVSVKKDITSPNSNGFPLSYINSNSGTVELSNIPVYQTDLNAATIFENHSTQSSFSNLLRQGVKFYAFLQSPSFQQDLTENIPLLTMYSHNWSLSDIDKVSVELYDITKIYHGMESPQFASERSNLFSIISTLLNTAGFSDYDYDNLQYVCKSSTSTPNFWYDESKTIMDNLQELLIGHQIGAWIDEYGIMRFKSLNNILQEITSNDFNPSVGVTDVTKIIGSSSIKYITNIIPGSYSESVGDKVGKIQIKYRIPKDFDSADIDEKNNKNSAGETWFLNSQSYPQVWKEEDGSAIPNFPLNASLDISDSSMSFDPNITFYNPRKNIGQYHGELFVGSEIIGYNGMEYVFFPIGNPSVYITKIITEQGDIARAIEEISDIYTSSGAPITQVEYRPTGRLVGLQRGKYGTTPQSHPVVKYTSDFYTYSYSIHNTSVASPPKGVAGVDKHGLFLAAAKKDEYIIITPKVEKGSGHNLFALDFTVSMLSTKRKAHTDTVRYKKVHGKLVKDKHGTVKKKVTTSAYSDYHNVAVGLFFNMNGNTVNGKATSGGSFSGSDATHFAEIRSVQSSRGKKTVSYLLSFYFISGNKMNYLIKDYPVHNVFDGVPHRLSMYMQGKEVGIAIDGIKISNATPFTVKNRRTGKNVTSNAFYNQAGTRFGAFIKSLENQSVKVYINELYADTVSSDTTGKKISVAEYPLDTKYYFMSTPYLNNLVRGFAQTKNYYLFQSFPQAYGFKLYDVKHSLSPIRPFSARIVPVMYGSQAVSSKTNEKGSILGPVLPEHVSYSELNSTPFRSKFAVVNNTDELVVLSSGKDSQSHEPLQIFSNYQLLSEERIIERVVDPNYTLSIDLSTSWVGSKSEAEKIMATLVKSTNTFYTDLSVSVFGNPLIQVGDFAQLTYGLKRIGYDPANPSTVSPVNCIITSVEQSISSGLGDTKLTLKPLIIS